MPQQKQETLLKEFFLNFKWFNTWILLTSGTSHAFRHFLSGNFFHISTCKAHKISRKLMGNKTCHLHLVQCCLESGNDDMYKLVNNLLPDYTIDLSGQTFNAMIMHALILLISR